MRVRLQMSGPVDLGPFGRRRIGVYFVEAAAGRRGISTIGRGRELADQLRNHSKSSKVLNAWVRYRLARRRRNREEVLAGVSLSGLVRDLPVATSSAANRLSVPLRSWSWLRRSTCPGRSGIIGWGPVEPLDLGLLVDEDRSLSGQTAGSRGRPGAARRRCRSAASLPPLGSHHRLGDERYHAHLSAT